MLYYTVYLHDSGTFQVRRAEDGAPSWPNNEIEAQDFKAANDSEAEEIGGVLARERWNDTHLHAKTRRAIDQTPRMRVIAQAICDWMERGRWYTVDALAGLCGTSIAETEHTLRALCLDGVVTVASDFWNWRLR